MNMAVISLIVLAVVVAIGFIKKINIGFAAVGAAYVLGTAGGMSSKEVIAGFNSSLFVTMVGVTFLFGVASVNGTLDLFSKKVVALVGKRTYMIPVLMFFLSAFISAIGPGHIATGILMTTFAMYLAFEMDINPFATALYAKLGANAGCASPLAITGVLAKNLSEPLGYGGPDSFPRTACAGGKDLLYYKKLYKTGSKPSQYKKLGPRHLLMNDVFFVEGFRHEKDWFVRRFFYAKSNHRLRSGNR